MDWRSKLRSWRRLAGDVKGVAALEFALVVPIVIIVYAAGFEIAQASTVFRKLTDTTVQLANVTSQYTSVTKSDASNIMSASAQIMAPYPTTPLKIVLTEVQTDTNNKATVVWSQPYGTGAVALVAGAAVTMPANFSSAKSYYILVQTTYGYDPTIGKMFVNSIPMTDQIYMVPRQSANIPCKDC
jgi:Flp pilus assembly protein TadG